MIKCEKKKREREGDFRGTEGKKNYFAKTLILKNVL